MPDRTLRDRLTAAVGDAWNVRRETDDFDIIEVTVDAVMAVLDTPHVVEFTCNDWFTEHSIPCRDAGMRNCEIHQRVAAMCRHVSGPPMPMGRYTARMLDDGAQGRHLDLQPC